MNKLFSKRLTRQMKRVIALIAMGIIGMASVVSVAAFSRQVIVTDKGQTSKFITLNSEPSKILDQLGLTVGSNDVVIMKEDDSGVINIVIKRAFEVSVKSEDVNNKVIMVSGTVEDAIKKAGIQLDDNDLVNPKRDEILTPGMEITVQHCNEISITADGQTKSYIVPDATVEQAIEYAGIQVKKDDEISIKKETQVTEGMEISIGRVEYREVNKTVAIPYEKIKIDSSSLNKGTTKVKTKGVNGEKDVLVKEKLVDGKVVETKELSSVITKEAVAEEVLVGTKPVKKPSTSSGSKYGYSVDNNNGTLIDHNGKVVKYRSVMYGSCTAYTAPSGAGTATGRPAALGNVAVNPNIIPYGTKMYICSPDGKFVYGYAIAADTGGALMKGLGLVDLFYPSLAECYNFGRRNMVVYFL